MKTIEFGRLSRMQQIALVQAELAMKTAYSPYSGFQVGACLVCFDGSLVTGSNFENSAYGSTICAERSAIVHANAIGFREFQCIAIIAKGENFCTTDITGPCGSCRQVLYESSQISNYNLEVILSTTNKDKIVVTTIKDLLPLAFGPMDLGIDLTKYRTRS